MKKKFEKVAVFVVSLLILEPLVSVLNLPAKLTTRLREASQDGRDGGGENCTGGGDNCLLVDPARGSDRLSN